MCAGAHRTGVRGRTLRSAGGAPWGPEDAMITTRTTQSFHRQDDFPPERRFISALLIGMSVLALAGCTSTVMSLAALH